MQDGRLHDWLYLAGMYLHQDMTLSVISEPTHASTLRKAVIGVATSTRYSTKMLPLWGQNYRRDKSISLVELRRVADADIPWPAWRSSECISFSGINFTTDGKFTNRVVPLCSKMKRRPSFCHTCCGFESPTRLRKNQFFALLLSDSMHTCIMQTVTS